MSLDEAEPSESRIRANVCKTLVNRFRTCILKFQKEQSEIGFAKRSRAVRLLQISSKESLTKEQAESLVEKGVTLDMAMKELLTKSDSDEGDLLSASLVQERVQDLRQLEKSIADLNDMFNEMSNLLGQQGSMLDSIEYDVVNVKNYTNLSAKSLITAKKKQRSNLKLVLYIILSCIILVAVIVLPLIFTDAMRRIFKDTKPSR